MKKETGLIILSGLALLAFGSWLASNPSCRRGCQTVAQHLREHAIREIIQGLLAA